MPGSASPRRSGAYVIALTAVIVLAAAMLRAPFVAVAPVARTIGAELGVSAGVVGLLTSIPVLCFAVFAPIGIAVVRRGGADFALTLTLVGAVAGSLIRSSGGIELALVGTAVMGLFLTIGNVVIPVIIGREFSGRRAHTMTGVYTSSLNLGTMLVTLTTVPLADAVGWRWALFSWSVFALAALAIWLPLRGLRAAVVPQAGPRPPAESERTSVWRHRPTMLLAAAFAGQAFAFYAVTAWLPTLLADQGFQSAAAGAVAAVFQVAGIGGSMLLPLLTVRASPRAGVVVVGVLWATFAIGFLVAPSLWLAWCLLGGVAQGGGITVVFIMISALASDEHTGAGRSGIVQGVGYGVASIGPIVVGSLHEATGAWTLPLLLVLVAVALFTTAGLFAARAIARTRP